jgi:hypothetical protein
MKNVHIKSPEEQRYEPALCPEEGGSTLPRNVYKFLKHYMVSLSDDTPLSEFHWQIVW